MQLQARCCTTSLARGPGRLVSRPLWMKRSFSDPSALKATGRNMATGNGHVAAAAAGPAPDTQPANGRTPQSAPLSLVVSDAVRRWYADAHREALKGDVKQQALLGQMLMEGYGCERDPEAGKEWADKAKRRGYRMEGVYCRI